MKQKTCQVFARIIFYDIIHTYIHGIWYTNTVVFTVSGVMAHSTRPFLAVCNQKLGVGLVVNYHIAAFVPNWPGTNDQEKNAWETNILREQWWKLFSTEINSTLHLLNPRLQAHVCTHQFDNCVTIWPAAFARLFGRNSNCCHDADWLTPPCQRQIKLGCNASDSSSRCCRKLCSIHCLCCKDICSWLNSVLNFYYHQVSPVQYFEFLFISECQLGVYLVDQSPNPNHTNQKWGKSCTSRLDSVATR